MKSSSRRLTLLLAFGLSSLPAIAAFEKWTNEDGRSVSMEFIRLVEADGEKAAEFKLVNGKLATVKLSSLVEADANRLAGGGKAPAEPEAAAATENAVPDHSAVFDEAIKKLRAGQQLANEEIEKCSACFDEYYKALFKKHGVDSNTALPENDRTDFYINAMKMSLIQPKKHNGWPVISDVRLMVLGGLQKKAAQKEDLFVEFCIVMPAIDSGDQELAAKAMNKLIKKDQFLAKTAAKCLLDFRVGNEEEAAALQVFSKATGVTFTKKKKDGEANPKE